MMLSAAVLRAEPGPRQQEQHRAGGGDGAALEAAAGGEMAVDDHIGAEGENQRQQHLRAGRDDLAGSR